MIQQIEQQAEKRAIDRFEAPLHKLNETQQDWCYNNAIKDWEEVENGTETIE